MFKSNQTWHRVSHEYLESKKKRFFAIACLEKKFVFQLEISTCSLTFKNIEFISGQGVVQVEPNSVWSIPCEPKV